MIELVILFFMALVIGVSYKINRRIDDTDDRYTQIDSKGDRWL